MNLEHAIHTIAKRGFTDRQARFLVLVARHSGVCVMRQYSSFAGIVFGQKTRKFFAKLVRLGFVSTYDCAHNRGRVYHVRHRAIYEAIGEPDSRLRRPPGVPRALERLMLLDAILENPESIWMSSSAEKVDYLSSRGISTDDAPHLIIRQGDQRRVRHFPDRLPIGVHPSGHVVFVYLHADPMRDEFRDFLQRHAPLLERLPAWTIRIVVPAHLEGAVQDLQKAAWGQLASPLKEPILTELRWYFERVAEPSNRGEPGGDRAASNGVDRAFATDRYTVLYRCWRQDGERVLATASSPVVGTGDGVRRWENRAPGVAARLQPPGADGRRRLKASAHVRFSVAQRHGQRYFAQLKSTVTTLSFVLAVTQQFGLSTEATQQLVLVEHHLLDGVRRSVQPARVVVDPLRDPKLSIHALGPRNLARSELHGDHDAGADVGAAERSVRASRTSRRSRNH